MRARKVTGMYSFVQNHVAFIVKFIIANITLEGLYFKMVKHMKF